MPQLPNEIVLHILKHRRKLSWNIFKRKIHQRLEKCFVTTTNSVQTNFDFRGHWVTYLQGTNIEIFISQRPTWVVVSYILLLPQQLPQRKQRKTTSSSKPLERYKKIIYCPVHHIN